jgi:hypothetical protein
LPPACARLRPGPRRRSGSVTQASDGRSTNVEVAEVLFKVLTVIESKAFRTLAERRRRDEKPRRQNPDDPEGA